MSTNEKLVEALEIVLRRKADRFFGNAQYLEHVHKSVATLEPKTFDEAFVFGALDAMIQDFGSAAQMTRPPRSPIDVSFRENRLGRLQKWVRHWRHEKKLPLNG